MHGDLNQNNYVDQVPWNLFVRHLAPLTESSAGSGGVANSTNPDLWGFRARPENNYKYLQIFAACFVL